MKKISSILLVVALLISVLVLPIAASSAEEKNPYPPRDGIEPTWAKYSRKQSSSTKDDNPNPAEKVVTVQGGTGDPYLEYIPARLREQQESDLFSEYVEESADGTEGTFLRFVDRKSISKVDLDEILIQEESYVIWDTLNGNAVESRLIFPASRVKADTPLTVDVNEGSAAVSYTRFSKAFDNTLLVVGVSQGETLGTVQTALLLPEEMQSGDLYFYSYDTDTNVYAPLTTTYKLDQVGFVHFPAEYAEMLVISQGPLG